jgi:hypothetical protein
LPALPTLAANGPSRNAFFTREQKVDLAGFGHAILAGDPVSFPKKRLVP